MSMNSLGTGEPMMPSTLCRFVANPNSSAASVARSGCHRPKITAARAMKPIPLVISLLKAPTESSVKYAPPMPATAPASTTVQNRVRFTSMPTVSAALGCSPTERTRSPQRVWYRAYQTRKTATYMRYTMIVCRKNTGPMIGISDSSGMGRIGNRGGELNAAAFEESTWE